MWRYSASTDRIPSRVVLDVHRGYPLATDKHVYFGKSDLFSKLILRISDAISLPLQRSTERRGEGPYQKAGPSEIK